VLGRLGEVVALVELDRRAVEELEVEVQLLGGVGRDVAVEGVVILARPRVSSARPRRGRRGTAAASYVGVLELDDVGPGHERGRVSRGQRAREGGEGRQRPSAARHGDLPSAGENRGRAVKERREIGRSLRDAGRIAVEGKNERREAIRWEGARSVVPGLLLLFLARAPREGEAILIIYRRASRPPAV